MDISGILDDLSTCLCAQILTDGLPPVCTCGVMPGSEVALDYAGDCDSACGMAWVRLTSSYPSVSIGQPTARPGNCSAGIGIEVEIGIMRCIDLGDGTNPPVLADMKAAADLQYADMVAMLRAIACCRASKDWLLGTYIPYGPQGGMVGGIMPLALLVL
jgi:hypothetical protein